MKWMIVRKEEEKFYMNTIRNISDMDEFLKAGFEVVGTYKTKAAATKDFNNMGGWIVNK